MTSKIVVNNIESDTGISSVTLISHVAGHNSTQNISGINSVTANTFHGSGANLTSLSAANLTGALPAISGANLTGLNSDVVSDTSPQLGGDLESNSNDIKMATNDRIVFGSDALRIKHTGDADIENTTGNIIIKNDSSSSNEEIRIQAKGGEDSIKAIANGAVQLYHDNRLRAYTVSNAFYVEQSELNDDCDVLVTNKSTTIGNNQKSQISLRVAKDAGGSHGGTNRTATFGHNYNASTGGGGFFTIRSNDGTHRDFYMDNNTNLRVNYGHSNIGTTNGTVVGSQSSDIRNKNLVGDGTVSYGLSEVLQLNPIKYQYKKELVDRIGFSAQQVEPIIPESVYDTKQDQDNEGNTVSGDTIKAMYYVDLIPVLVNAIKELKAENDALKKRLDDGGL